MAWKQSFTDASGNECTEAYWQAVQVNVGRADRTCYIVFYAYKDASAKALNKAPLIGAIKTYTISGDDFDDFYAKHIAPGGPNLLQMVYGYSKEKKDVDTGQKDENGEPILVSFFENATEA